MEQTAIKAVVGIKVNLQARIVVNLADKEFAEPMAALARNSDSSMDRIVVPLVDTSKELAIDSCSFAANIQGITAAFGCRQELRVGMPSLAVVGALLLVGQGKHSSKASTIAGIQSAFGSKDLVEKSQGYSLLGQLKELNGQVSLACHSSQFD